MYYIYSRVSTSEQNTVNQTRVLIEKYPHAIIIEEQASGAKDRPKLEELLKILKPQDTLVIYALDRLGRKASETVKLLEDFHKKNITLISLKEGIDLSTVAGRLISNIMASVASFERERIVERTKTSLQRLKAEGVTLGRPKDLELRNKVLELQKQQLKQVHIAKLLNLSKGRISQLLRSMDNDDRTVIRKNQEPC
jgi:hypothetical protein